MVAKGDDPVDAVVRVLAGRYELREVLGRGGVGVAYRGVDTWNGRFVAVKVVDDGLVRGLGSAAFAVRELWTLAEQRHAGLAEILDIGNDPERGVCLVSALIEDAERLDTLADGPLHPDAVLEIADRLLSVLADLHAQGAVHGDLKPSDVLVVRRGGALRVKVTDYGLVRVLSGTGTRFTPSGDMIGGAAWTPPEEAERGADGTAWNPAEIAPGGPEGDVYSAGCILYGLLTGVPLFRGDVQGLLHQHVHRTAEPPSHAVPHLSPHWDALMLRALAKRPEDRYPDASAMREALEPLREQDRRPAAAAPPPPPARGSARPVRRRSRALWLAPVAVLAAAAVAVAAVGLLGGEDDPSAARPSPSSPGSAAPLAAPGAAGPVVLGQLARVDDHYDEDTNAVQLAVQAYNSANPEVAVQLRVYDPGKGGSLRDLTASALADGVAGLLGPFSDADVPDVLPVLDDAGVPAVSYVAPIAGTRRHLGLPLWHRLLPSDDIQAEAVASVLSGRLRARTVAVVHDGSADGGALASALAAEVRSTGGTVRQWEYRAGDAEFRGLADGIRAFEPGAVFVAGHTPEAGFLLKTLRPAGVRASFLGGDGLLDPDLIRDAGPDAEGTIVSCACLMDPQGTSVPASKGFADVYRAAFGTVPVRPYGAEAHDAATLFLEAVRAGRTTREGIEEWLDRADLQGASGRLGFTEDGGPKDRTIYLYKVVDGGFVLLGPSTTAIP